MTFVLAALRWKWSTLLQRMGDCSYGLYLLHVPLIGVAVHALKDSGVRVSLFWIGTFAFATAGGLAFGWLEFRLHRAAKGLRQTLGWTRPDARTAGVP